MTLCAIAGKRREYSLVGRPFCFDSVQCNIKLYADDAKLYSSYRLDDSTLSVDLNLILKRLAIWAKTCQMQIAYNKCFVHRISSNNISCTSCFKYCISGIELDWSIRALVTWASLLTTI